MNYKVLLFDIDETLFDFKATERLALKYTLDDFSVRKDYKLCQIIYNGINKKLWRELEEGLITSSELRVKRFELFLKEINEDIDSQLVSDTYIKYLSLHSYTFPEAEQVIKTLSKHYRLVIITNGIKEVQLGRLDRSGLREYFEEVIISDEYNISKPDARLFDIALNKIKFLDKGRVLMIGDSLTSDIKGGINAEIDTCWYNPSRIKNLTKYKSKYEIQTLLQLYDILL